MNELPGLGLDPEEVRIFRQSIPAEEVTRDFLQDLLNEHRAGSERHPGMDDGRAGNREPSR